MVFFPLDAARHEGAFQIVATIGPASCGLVEPLAEAGATAFRLNCSHLTPEALADALESIRGACPEAPIVVDLQGAKMRLGCFPAREVRAGDVVTFLLHHGANAVPLPHAELFAHTSAGDTLSLDDDKLRFEVQEVDAVSLKARALRGGRLLPRKGVNVVEHPVELQDLGPADLAALDCAGDRCGVAWAVSFMKDGHEAEWVRRRRPRPVVIGKLERREALENTASIAHEVEALWVCRGDLGAQIGAAALARFVSAFGPLDLRRPVLMAGQVLEHLTEHAEPTRSEVCHLFDLVARGYAGLVLSDETAIGRDPVQAVRTVAELVDAFRARS